MVASLCTAPFTPERHFLENVCRNCLISWNMLYYRNMSFLERLALQMFTYHHIRTDIFCFLGACQLGPILSFCRS